ncbi:MAG: hypothetical protein ACI8QD_001813 [Cyclobacteriaceae bacterium]|jgi:hypothetical protein
MLHALVVGLILFTLSLFGRGAYPRWSYYLAFLLKATATIGVGYYYLAIAVEGDTIIHFQEAVSFNNKYGSNPLTYFNALVQADISNLSQNWRSVFFVKMISPIVLFTGNQYWITSLYLTLISFIAIWSSMQVINRYYGHKWLLYLAFFTIPTSLFWTGGLFKEAIANSAFYLAISIILCLAYIKVKWPSALLLLLCAFLLYKLRFYGLGIAIIFGVGYLLLTTASISRGKQLASIFLMLVVGFGAAQFLHPYLRPSRLPLTLFESYQSFQPADDQPGIELDYLDSTYIGLLLSTPKAWASGLFRPFPGETWQLHYLPFILEKLAFLLLAIWTIVRIKSLPRLDLWLFGLLCLSMLATFLAISTPNFGSLVRYQSIFTPFLFLLFALLPLKKFD